MKYFCQIALISAYFRISIFKLLLKLVIFHIQCPNVPEVQHLSEGWTQFVGGRERSGIKETNCPNTKKWRLRHPFPRMRAIALSTPFAVIGILSWRSCFKPEVCWDGKTWKKQAAVLLTQTGSCVSECQKCLHCFWLDLALVAPVGVFFKIRCGYQTLKTAVFWQRDPSLWRPKLHYSTNVFSRWWFSNIFDFHLYLGKWSNLTIYYFFRWVEATTLFWMLNLNNSKGMCWNLWS